MNYTTNYKIPLYESSDPTSYLTTYNETMKLIDTSLHALALKVANGELNDRQFTAEISAIKGRLDTAENTINTLKTELATTNGKVSENVEDISTLKTQLIEQGTSIKSLLARVSALETSFESFKSTQEQKNSSYEDSLSGLSTRIDNNAKKQDLKNSEFTSEIANIKAMRNLSKSYFDRHEKPTEESGWQFNGSISISSMTDDEIDKCSLNLIIGKKVNGHDKGTNISVTRYSTIKKPITFYFADTSEITLKIDFDKTAKTITFRLEGIEKPTIETDVWSLSILASVTLN